MSNPARSAILVALIKSAVTISISARDISRGVALSGDQGIGEAEINSQLSFNKGLSIPSHPNLVDPLRPEWPI